MSNAEQILERIEKTVRKGPNKLTAGSPVLARLVELCQGEIDIKEVQKVLRQDPAMVAQVLRNANSVAYRGAGVEVTTIRQACVRLGVRELKSVLMTAAVSNMLKIKNKTLAPLMKRLRAHALGVARSARAFAKARHLEAEEVYLAGLMHDIGRAAAVAYLDTDADERQVVAFANFARVRLGLALVELWKLPSYLPAVIEGAETFEPAEGLSMRNLVVLGKAYVRGHGLDAGEVDLAAARTLFEQGAPLLALDPAALQEVAETIEKMAAKFDD